MVGQSLFLGIDVSTTATKALVVDSTGKVLAVASSPHTLQTPRLLWVEQDPQEWWHAASSSIRKVLQKAGVSGDHVTAVGMTGQMHGLVLLDEHGNVLRPAILWNDQRTQPQCDWIHQQVGKEKYIQVTGNVALTGFTAPKIIWVKQNEPEVYAKVRHILLPKDYVRYCLTGEYALDKADGAGTVLFDLKNRNWSPEVLTDLGIDPAWMPPTYEGPEFTGYITPQAAEITGLKAGTPVAAGGGDQSAQAVGVGAVKPGIVSVTLGTSGVIFATTPSAMIEPEGRLHAFCHAVPGRWHFMGVMLSAAGSLQWHRDTLAPDMSFDDLLAEAQKAPAGCEGLQFLPYLSGERTPYPDPLARGAFLGLTLRHNRAYMTRSVLEGVAFGLKDVFSLIRTAGLGKIDQVRISGGGVKSSFWLQIIASVLEVELVTVNTVEGAAFGAALLAGVGSGAWKDVETACAETVAVNAGALPDASQVDIYRQSYQVYRQLYPTLMPIFHKM